MRRAARLARDEWPSPRFAARYRTRLTGLVTRYGRREGDPFAPASNSSEAVVLKPSLTPRVAEPRALASGSQRRSRPQNRGLEAHRFQGNVAGENDQGRPRKSCGHISAYRPQETARLVEIRVVRQMFNGAIRCWPARAPPRPSVMRYVPTLCHAIRMNSPP